MIWFFNQPNLWSTEMELAKSVMTSDGEKVKNSFEFEYPLVHPNKEHRFWFQVNFEDDAEGESARKDYNGQWCISVVPKHGKARVDPLPADFGQTEYCKFENGLVLLNNVNTPGDVEDIKKEVYLNFCPTNVNSEKWCDTDNTLLYVEKDIDYGQALDTYIGDIKPLTMASKSINMAEYPYFFVWMIYSYKIKNFDKFTFRTPKLISKIFENNFFKDAEANRKTSNTTMETVAEGTKVTFSGNGYFDGLYEGDLAVSYGGSTFVPAVFVSGLDVYILSVDNGEYTAKGKKKISEYLAEGGSFGNMDDGVAYAKLKTDSSEANLDRTPVTNTIVKGSF